MFIYTTKEQITRWWRNKFIYKKKIHLRDTHYVNFSGLASAYTTLDDQANISFERIECKAKQLPLTEWKRKENKKNGSRKMFFVCFWYNFSSRKFVCRFMFVYESNALGESTFRVSSMLFSIIDFRCSFFIFRWLVWYIRFDTSFYSFNIYLFMYFKFILFCSIFSS